MNMVVCRTQRRPRRLEDTIKGRVVGVEAREERLGQ